jgi:hypothetical protein
MHVDIKLDINVYKDRGTIFDGILVQNNNNISLLAIQEIRLLNLCISLISQVAKFLLSGFYCPPHCSI